MTFEEYEEKQLHDLNHEARRLVRMGWNARGTYGADTDDGTRQAARTQGGQGADLDEYEKFDQELCHEVFEKLNAAFDKDPKGGITVYTEDWRSAVQYLKSLPREDVGTIGYVDQAARAQGEPVAWIEIADETPDYIKKYLRETEFQTVIEMRAAYDALRAIHSPPPSGANQGGAPLHKTQIRALRRNVERNCGQEMTALLDRLLSTIPSPSTLNQGGVPPEEALWEVYEAAQDILFRRAAPHAWESQVHEACLKVILKWREKLTTSPNKPEQEWADACGTSDRLPEIGQIVLGYHPDWVDEDFCKDGIRECFLFGDGSEWQSARWDGYWDQWIVEDGAPELWQPHPQPPQEQREGE